MKHALRSCLAFLCASTLAAAAQPAIHTPGDNATMYLIATDTMPNDGQSDVTDAIQLLIDNNPNRTIFFPDGTYLISRPILTPAAPARSVSLKLADFAVIKASPNWQDTEAMLRLGASHPANDINTNGSNFSLSGGIIDGSEVASGVSIDGGRETFIRDVSIKHTRIGIHIKRGANNGSSDADITHVNIVGTGKTDSIGVLLDGYDNTMTDMRIAKVHTGVVLKSAGNSLRNIHPLYIHTQQVDDVGYLTSCGFYDIKGSNWFSSCYSDHFATGFKTGRNAVSVFNSCISFWYCGCGACHTAFHAEGSFNSVLTDFRAGFNSPKVENIFLVVEEEGGCGVLERPRFKLGMTKHEQYKAYLKSSVIDR